MPPKDIKTNQYSPKIFEKIPIFTFLYIFCYSIFVIAKTICVDSISYLRASIDEYYQNVAFYTKPAVTVVFMILLSWVSDSYMGKYEVLRLCFVLMMVLPAMVMVIWILPPGSDVIFVLANVVEAISFSFIGVAYAFTVDQIRSKDTIRPLTFIFVEMILFLEIFMQTQATFPKLFFALVIMILVAAAFILSEAHLKKAKVEYRCVEKTLRCLYIAMAKKIKLKNPDGLNWIERTEGECDENTILRTRVTFYICPLALLFSFLWCLNVDTHFKILTQQAISLPKTLDLLGYELVVDISVFICILLFEFFIVSYLRIKRIEPPIITAGLVIFALGLIVALFTQRSIEETKLILPSKTAQLTFYNMMEEKATMTSEFNKLTLSPYKKVVLLNLITQNGYLERNFSIESSKFNESNVLKAEDGKSFSVVIAETGMRQMNYADPLVMPYEKTIRHARVFFVFGTNATGNFIFKTERESIYLIRVKHPSLIFTNIEEGEYKISMHLNKTRPTRLEIDYPVHNKYIYSVVLYDKKEKGKRSQNAKVYEVFTPYPVSIYLLIPQLLFLICGMSVCLVSWFTFLFYYSHPDLRSVTITFYFISLYFWDSFFLSTDLIDPKFILVYALIHSCCTLLFLYSYVIN